MQEIVELSTLLGDDISHCIERDADLRDSTLQQDIDLVSCCLRSTLSKLFQEAEVQAECHPRRISGYLCSRTTCSCFSSRYHPR
jgi:hypothetical protein